MANEKGKIGWYDADPRAILPLDDSFHIPRSVARTIRRGRFEIRVDTAFRDVIKACAQPTPRRGKAWISREIIEAYSELHSLGFAHSVEAWLDGELVGGLYGVSLGGLFAGESMFSRVPDASKVALVHLTDRLRVGGFVLHDTQMMTPVVRSFGASMISRDEYQRRLAEALKVPAIF
ncbi:MAG: leucyl/phenylalanyl-tRNA--protein transferase [Chloroflexota bacterium]